MSRTLITALTIYGVGCVIPAPLEAERAAPNEPPLIVDSEPEFGYLAKNQQEFFSLKVTAIDQDLDDVLQARLLKKDGTLFAPLAPDTIQMSPSKADPRLREALFPSLPYCDFLRTADGLAYVFVTDGKFRSFPVNEIQDPATRYVDSKFWVMTCR